MVKLPAGVVSCNFDGSVTLVPWNEPFMMESTSAWMPGVDVLAAAGARVVVSLAGVSAVVAAGAVAVCAVSAGVVAAASITVVVAFAIAACRPPGEETEVATGESVAAGGIGPLPSEAAPKISAKSYCAPDCWPAGWAAAFGRVAAAVLLLLTRSIIYVLLSYSGRRVRNLRAPLPELS